MAPLGLGDVGSRLNQPRHLQLRATEQSYRSFLPFPATSSPLFPLSFFAYPPPLIPFLSLLSLLFLFFSLAFHSSSISPRQRSISDAYYQRYSFPRPTPFQRAAARFFFSFSLVFVFISRLAAPVNVSPLLERIPSFVDTRFLLPVNPPLRHLDWFMGTWRRGSLSSRLSSGIACSFVASVSSLLVPRFVKKYLLEILERG